MNNYKCVVIGPPVCGKTSLINTYMSGYFRGYIPNNVITNYDVNFICKSKSVLENSNLTLSSQRDETLEHLKNVCDGAENLFNQFRLYDYEIDKPNSIQFLKEDELDSVDIIILCYQSNSDTTKELLVKFREFIEKKWPSTPLMLVSSISDLIKVNSTDSFLDFNNNNTSQEKIQMLPFDEQLTLEMGAAKHYYCSALAKYNIDNVFKDAFLLAIKNRLYTEKLNLEMSSTSEANDYNSKDKNNELAIKKERSKEDDKLISWKINELKQWKADYDTKNQKYRTKLKEMNYYKAKNESLNGFIEPSCSRSVISSKFFRQLITIFSLVFFIFYFLSIRYCTKNKQHCNELYEITLEVIDDSISSFNESYSSLFHQLER